jgi:hypothetical protein
MWHPGVDRLAGGREYHAGRPRHACVDGMRAVTPDPESAAIVMPKGLVKVAVLGSCRVVNPLRPLNGRRIDIVNADNLWYTHSAPEAVQKVELLTSALRLDPALMPFVAGDEPAPADLSHARPDYFAGTEVAVVEVSASRVRRTADGALLHAVAVAAMEAAGKIQAHELHALSEAEETAALDRLCAAFPAVLLVSPIVLAPGLREVNPARDRLRQSLADYCVRRGSASVVSFDPMTVVAALGSDQALSDNNHFSRLGMAAVRQALVERIAALRGPTA